MRTVVHYVPERMKEKVVMTFFRVLFQYSFESTEEKHKNFSQITPEYKIDAIALSQFV
jgi:hypothetical protein